MPLMLEALQKIAALLPVPALLPSCPPRRSLTPPPAPSSEDSKMDKQAQEEVVSSHHSIAYILSDQ